MNSTLDQNNDNEEGGQDVFTGVPSTYEDMFQVLCFFLALFLVGDVFCKRCLKIVPSLVGYIMTGVILGPECLDVIPMVETWVLLGNIGLVLLMTQAGLEMDLPILQKVGPRGFVMAIVGSILPISVGMFLSKVVLGQSGSTVIAMGCCFGPTSVGIAINVLGQCSVLETPLGQLIVAAAIVDDIVALLVLSQLQALTGDVSVSQIVIPIVSAFAWLFIGGALALYVAPIVLQFVFDHIISNLSFFTPITGPLPNADNDRQTYSFIALLALLFCLLPATSYSQASYLLGAFLSGLSFCQEHSLSEYYQSQFKRLIGWLMKMFFAATIGFQVPLSEFNNVQVLRNGCILFLALLGKLAVGPLLTPKFDPDAHWWRGTHLRDCGVVGLSMAGEAEFAFLVAVFGVTEQLIPPDLYASVVLAILLSTIVSPLLLRTLLAVFPIARKFDEEDGDDNDHHSRSNNEENVDQQSLTMIANESNKI